MEKYMCFCARRDSSGKQLFSRRRSVGLNLMPYMGHWIWKAIDMCSMWGWHGQICILNWSLYDNAEDELMGQNLRQRNKPGSCCNRTALARTQRRNTWKTLTSVREGWGENNLPCGLGFRRRRASWCLSLTLSLLWLCCTWKMQELQFPFSALEAVRIWVKINDSRIKQIWIEVPALSWYLLWYHFTCCLCCWGQSIKPLSDSVSKCGNWWFFFVKIIRQSMSWF